MAKLGGNTAKVAREDLEKKLGRSIVVKENKLNYKYVDKKQIGNKRKKY